MPRSETLDLTGHIDVSKLRPLNDYILLEIMERNRSAGGLILPDKEKTECLFGKVLAVGPGECSPRTGEVFPMDIKPGDILMSVQYMGEKVTTLGKKYRLLREHGVWGKLKIDYKGEGNWDITEIQPYRDHLLLKMDDEEMNLKKNLFLPSNPQVMFRMATLITAGPGPRDQKTGVVSAMRLSTGDRVITLRYAGCIVKIKGVEHRMASFADIEGVMQDGIVDVLADPMTHPKPGDDYSVVPESHLDDLTAKILRDNGASK